MKGRLEEVIAFCDSLRTIGVDAKLRSELMDFRGLRLVPIGCSVELDGMIEIQQESPIRWVILFRSGDVYPEYTPPSQEGTIYIVPDSKLDKHMKKIKIEMVKLRNIPIIGKVKYVYWKGKDSDRGVIDSLNNDHDLMNLLMQLTPWGVQLHISSHYISGGSPFFDFPKMQMPSCWKIQSYGSGYDPPSNEEWSCYKLIAQHLLGERTIGSRLITKERKQGVKAIWFYKFLRILSNLLFWLLFFVFLCWLLIYFL